MAIYHRLRSLALLLASAAPFTITAPNAAAVEHRFSGFATLGIALNDNDELIFRRDVTQDDGALKNSGSWKTDSLLGLQWQGQWSPRWETTVQLVAKDRFDNTLGKSVEWAFVRYRPVEGLDLRLGRLGADVFMLSEYRQVGYAIPWVRPPHDMYGIASLYRFDGADITKRFTLGDAMLDLKGFYGNSDEKYPTGFNSGESTHFDFDLYGASASLEWNSWKFRYTYVQVEVNSDNAGPLSQALQQASQIWPAAMMWIPRLETHGKNFDYSQFGLTYDNNDWWFQTEFVNLGSDLTLISAGNHGYASLGKRVGQFNVYVLAGYADPENPTLDIQLPTGLPQPYAGQLALLEMAAERTLNGVRIKQHSVGAGVRWDFAAKMALKFQAEKFDVDKTGSNLWFRVDDTAPIGANQKPIVISLAWDMLF